MDISHLAPVEYINHLFDASIWSSVICLDDSIFSRFPQKFEWTEWINKHDVDCIKHHRRLFLQYLCSNMLLWCQRRRQLISNRQALYLQSIYEIKSNWWGSVGLRMRSINWAFGKTKHKQFFLSIYFDIFALITAFNDKIASTLTHIKLLIMWNYSFGLFVFRGFVFEQQHQLHVPLYAINFSFVGNSKCYEIMLVRTRKSNENEFIGFLFASF